MTPRRKALLDALRDEAPAVRSRVSEALDRLDVLESIPEVAKKLRTLGKAEWVGLLRGLAGLRDETSLKVAVHSLEHADEDVRLAALDAVESWCDLRASPAVARRLADESVLVRTRSAEVLGRLGDRRHAADVARLLDDPDAGVLARAAEALGLLNHTPSEPRLIGLLRHPESEVRAAAASALGRMGTTPGA